MGRQAKHGAVAVFERPEEARAAVVALERGGFPADDISLVASSDPRDTRAEDRRLTDEVGSRTVRGAAIGGAIGAVVGFAAGIIAFSIVGGGGVLDTGLWAVAIGGALAGGAVGGVASGLGGMGQSAAWEETHAAEEGHVLVAVQTPDEEAAGKAQELLTAHDPARVERLGANGPAGSS